MGGWVAVLVPYTCIQPTRQHFTGRHGAYPELSALLGGQVPELQKLFLRRHGEIRRSQARPKLILPKTMYTYRSTRIGPGMKQTILQPGER